MNLSVCEAPMLHLTWYRSVYVKYELFFYPTKLCWLGGILKSEHCCKRHWNTALPLPEQQTKNIFGHFFTFQNTLEKTSSLEMAETELYIIMLTFITWIHSCLSHIYLQHMVGLSQNTRLVRWKVHHTIWSVETFLYRSSESSLKAHIIYYHLSACRPKLNILKYLSPTIQCSVTLTYPRDRIRHITERTVQTNKKMCVKALHDYIIRALLQPCFPQGLHVASNKVDVWLLIPKRFHVKVCELSCNLKLKNRISHISGVCLNTPGCCVDHVSAESSNLMLINLLQALLWQSLQDRSPGCPVYVVRSHLECLVPFDIFSQTHLIIGHIESGDVPAFAHQLTEHVAVTSAATAEIQHPAALHTLGDSQTTAIVPEKKEEKESVT